MNNSCFHCKALSFNNDKISNKSTKCKIVSNMCCFNGKIELLEISQPPILIKNLLLNKEFQNNIRGYNGALSFTSLGVDLVEKNSNNMTGSYTFRIHGTVVHRLHTYFIPF
jgi:hypothetical protein